MYRNTKKLKMINIYLNQKWTKFKLLFIYIFIGNFLIKIYKYIYKEKNNIKTALCTIAREENLYVKEYIEYYLKLGVDHIFIYDDNDDNTEKIIDVIDKKFIKNVSVYETKKFNITNQSEAFTECYKSNYDKFDWFLMLDMDEYLYIVNNTLTSYLTNKRFNKCDFIKINWVIATDNDLIYYDPRPLFERFKPPYIKSGFVKSIIRGNISDLKYMTHSPYISPKRNITCNNIGKRIYYKDINFENIRPINIKLAYIIHFSYKSTEEFVKKIKRGYRNWLNERTEKFLNDKPKVYFSHNKVTPEKINYLENELNINLTEYKMEIRKKNKVNQQCYLYFRVYKS